MLISFRSFQQFFSFFLISFSFSCVFSFCITSTRLPSPTLQMAFGGLFAPKPKPIESISIKFSTMGVPNSEKFVSAEVGQTLEDVAISNAVTINYKCKKGECGTCLVNVDNKWVMACQTTIRSLSIFCVISFPSFSCLNLTNSWCYVGQERRHIEHHCQTCYRKR